MFPLSIEKVHRFYPIRRHVQVDMHLGVFEGFPCEPDIAGAIFYQKDFDRHCIRSNRFHHFSSLSGSAK